jgi:hypothetical protein
VRILVVAGDGATLGLAQRLVREGHKVDVFPMDMPIAHTGDNIYKITTNLWKAVQDCKFIIADRGWDKLYARANTYNKPIIGTHPMTDMLNMDAVKEYKLGTKLGARYPKTEIFSDFSGLQPKLLEGKYRRYYVKHERKTFVCTAPEWLAWAMYQLPVGEEVLLQEEAKGSEVSVVGWFNGLKWVGPFFYSTPTSKTSKIVAMLAANNKNELIRTTIYPFCHWLKKIDYKGPFTVNLILDGKEWFIKDVEAGLTGPSVFAMMEGIKNTGVADFMNQLAFSSGSVDITKDYLVGIEVSNRDADMYGAPILGVDDGNMSKIFLHGAYFSDDGYMMSGETESVYTAVAHGRDLKEAMGRVYRTIDQVQFPRMYYASNLAGGTAFEALRKCEAI